MFFNNKRFKDYRVEKFDLSQFDKEYIEDGNSRSFFSQMLDAGGEMNYTHQAFLKYTEDPNPDNRKSLEEHAKKMHKVCNLIIHNLNVYKEEAETLRFAEGQFYKYVFGYSTDSSCIKGFNQGCYDINYDLL